MNKYDAEKTKMLSSGRVAHDHYEGKSVKLHETRETVQMQKPFVYPDISVIIPTLNEAQNLPHVLPFIPDIVSEVILVDGCSTDDTIAIAQSLLPNIKVVHQTGKGKGNALQCGFSASTGDIIVMMDADGSTDPQEVTRFIETLLAGADFAKGSRFINGGGSADITPLRRFGNFVLSSIVNSLFHVHYTDLCYGYNAFWKDCLELLKIDCEGFEIEALMNVRACKAELHIMEVPSFEHQRIHGNSNLRTLRDGWRVLRVILREWVNARPVIKTTTVPYLDQQESIAWDSQAIIE